MNGLGIKLYVYDKEFVENYYRYSDPMGESGCLVIWGRRGYRVVDMTTNGTGSIVYGEFLIERMKTIRKRRPNGLHRKENPQVTRYLDEMPGGMPARMFGLT